MITVVFYIFLFLYGIIIGSFLNVCILRVPLKETVVSKRSHCMKCGHQLAWYDLFPLFSYLFLRGKCRYCKSKISKQYPIVEFLNGVLAVLCFLLEGFLITDIDKNIDWARIIYWFITMLLSAVVCSVLLVISVIDWRTFEIPIGSNIVILVVGMIHLVANVIVFGFDGGKGVNGSAEIWWEYILGFFVVSVPLAAIYYISKGRAMGGGDVKLMAVSGLFLGWKLILLALVLGCLYGSVIHIIRMKVSGEGKQLAMGPYLSAGIVTSIWFGKYIVEWYAGFLP